MIIDLQINKGEKSAKRQYETAGERDYGASDMIVGVSQDNSPSPMIKTVEASMVDSSTRRGYNGDDGEEVVNFDNGDADQH